MVVASLGFATTRKQGCRASVNAGNVAHKCLKYRLAVSSEGRGQRFESSRVHQFSKTYATHRQAINRLVFGYVCATILCVEFVRLSFWWGGSMTGMNTGFGVEISLPQSQS